MIGDRNPLARIAGAVKGMLEKDPPHVPTERRACVIAHRGAARECPENTIEAFRRAVEIGADGIETDVCVTSDGVFVLWHDADPDEKVALARETIVKSSEHYDLWLPDLGEDRRRRVCELPLAKLRESFGYVRKGPDGEPGARVPISLLSDLFSWASGETRLAHVFLDVKLKADQVEEARRLLRVADEEARRARPGLTYHFLSTQKEVLEALVDEARRAPPSPALKLTADFELPKVLENARRLGLRDVSMGCGQRSWPGFLHELREVAAARQAGELDSVVVWTLNEKDEIASALSLGVDGVMTDDPRLLASLETSASSAS
jgi:glycerophosphoryl diester phosphodiesterase